MRLLTLDLALRFTLNGNLLKKTLLSLHSRGIVVSSRYVYLYRFTRWMKLPHPPHVVDRSEDLLYAKGVCV